MNERMKTDKKIFDKRSGTTHKGEKYEDLLTALIAFNLVKNDKVGNFYLSSNVKNFGKFDDVVVEIFYKNSDKPTRYAIQVKHKDSERKKVSEEMLMGEKGDYSIQQYYKCYKDNETKFNDYNLIIYTNASASDFSNVNLHLHTICQVPISEDFLNTSNQDYVYKFKPSNNDQTVNTKEKQEYASFFENLFLYTNQKKFDKMKATALMSFKEVYCCKEDSFNMFLDFISNWSEVDGRKCCLDKQTVQLKIAEIVLKPLMKNTSVTSQDNSKYLLFQEIALQYDVVLVETDRDVRWNEVFCRTTSIQEISRISRKFGIISKEMETLGETEDEQVFIALWHMNKIPLVIQITEENKAINQAIEMCQDKNGARRKFVVVGKKIKEEVFKNAKIFRNLKDLDSDSALYKNIVQHNKVSLQGREAISLEEVIKGNEEMREAITTDELIKIMDGFFQIGEAKEDLPDPYIDQFVSKIVVDLKIIRDPNILGVMVISCNEKLNLLQTIAHDILLIPVDQFLNKHWKESKRYVIVAEDKCTTKEFEAICAKSIDKTCHHFCMMDNRYLEWVTTKGKIDQLKGYLLPSHFVEESEVFKSVDNKINIISALPGMGKSVMLKYLKNSYSSDFWILYISFKEIFENIQHSKSVLRSILELQTKKYNYSSFETKVTEIFVKQKRVVFLWDGLDELPNHFIQPAIEAIEDLSHRGFTCWITARQYFEELLKNRFNVFPMTIKHLKKEQQNTYIKKYLQRSHHSKEEIEEVVQKITSLIAITQNIDLLGIPLQIKILSELFYRNTKKYFRLIDHTFSFADMIYYFIKEKFKVCFGDKGKCDVNNHFIKKIIKELRNFKFLQYETIALKMFLPKAIFNTIQTKVLTPLTDDEFGIITQINCENNTATFLHNIYGEYFVATWLLKNFANVSDFSNFFFDDAYKNIRMIFDMKAAKNCPAHLAVLYKNFDVLIKFPVDQKDAVGRNPLHLACSLGQKHPSLLIEEKKDKYVLDFLKGGLIKEDGDDYKKIINFLSEKCDPFETDILFHWNSITYADHTFSLFPIEIFLKRHKIAESLGKLSDVASLVFYSVKFNYANLFQFIGDVPYIENNNYDLNLLHHVIKYKRSEFLDKVFKNEKYSKVIDKLFCMEKLLGHIKSPLFTNNQDMSVSTIISAAPLHIASCFGDNEAVNILIEHKANVNLVNIHGHLPLHWASDGGHLETVKLLRKNGSVLNQVDDNGLNELNSAVSSGSLELVNYLLENGTSIYMNKDQVTPLETAVEINRADILELLIKKGTPGDDIQNFVTSSWIRAICKGKEDIIKCFIKNGIVINDPIDQLSPLHYATQSGNTVAVKTLLEHKANVNICCGFGRTPLHYACLRGTLEIVELLLQKGADINATDCNGTDPLTFSIFGRHENISKYLIQSKTLDTKKSSALMAAIIFSSTEFIEFLIENGANVKQKNSKGVTPLHIAACLDRRDVVRILKSHGANEHKRDDSGITPRNILRWSKQGLYPEDFESNNYTNVGQQELTVDLELEIEVPQISFKDMINSIY